MALSKTWYQRASEAGVNTSMPAFRILIDVDEVLADFQTPVLKVMSQLFGSDVRKEHFKTWDIFENLTKEQVQSVFSHINVTGFCSALEPTPGSQDAIEKLKGLGDVYIVTSPVLSSPTWVHERSEWLWRYFSIPSKHVIHTSAKYLVRGNALLDDRPDHIRNWKTENPEGLGMMWHIPNTAELPHDDIRVKSWQEVIEKVSLFKRASGG